MRVYIYIYIGKHACVCVQVMIYLVTRMYTDMEFNPNPKNCNTTRQDESGSKLDLTFHATPMLVKYTYNRRQV